MAQGIVAPQDVVNNSTAKVLNFAKKGDGIFVISKEELNKINPTESEMEIIKPYYTSEQLNKYSTIKTNRNWIIYTTSDFKNSNKIEEFPSIKKHLDKFSQIITSDNKPYGLHRSRNESFFKNIKIMSLRKCITPTFTYTDFECYVSQSYFILKTNRVNLKYLTAVLNSKVIKFWLKNKGKMQGQIYQIDKEPLLNIPIFLSEYEKEIIGLLNKIIEISSDENLIFESIREIDILIYKTLNLTIEDVRLN